ncbi:PRK06851 family protein [Cohnella candidum]|uniref:NACHT domain-containing protein n=1 Tax=Cohnella candidum TaxID=2674991 RepID=A0A3G3K1F8_9BACL|nr:PRK06851 family protein [Cohnella candidum]AYQ74395.1 hypothetical protein EAV92_18555 [Cohnella candidum]
MSVTASHYFARGNTASGAHFLYESAFRGLDRIFVLSGPRGTGKSMVLRRLADHLIEKGQHVECFHSPLRPDELDGIIATELEVGILDGRASGDFSAKSTSDTLSIDFGEAFDLERISPEDLETIDALQEKLDQAYAKSYETFAAALRIHDEWEKYYIGSMDFAKADRIAQELSEELFSGRAKDTPVIGRHVFFGAATPKGAFDYIQSLTASLSRRIFVKGRPGSGKSTMLKKLAAAAESKGIDVRVFHCGFDPNSLDMLIFPELSTAIFDSTAPHEYFPDREGDEILDMYALTMTAGTDEAYANELAPIKERYSAGMKEATAYLAEAEAIDAQIKSIYTAATDFAIVESHLRQLQSALDERLSLEGTFQLQ